LQLSTSALKNIQRKAKVFDRSKKGVEGIINQVQEQLKKLSGK